MRVPGGRASRGFRRTHARIPAFAVEISTEPDVAKPHAAAGQGRELAFRMAVQGVRNERNEDGHGYDRPDHVRQLDCGCLRRKEISGTVSVEGDDVRR